MRIGPVLEDGRARAVPEQHASGAVLPVDDRRKFLRADDQHALAGAGHDELLAYFQRVDEARARRLEVEGRRPLRPDLVLHQAGRGWERHVRRDGGDDDEIDLIRCDARLGHRALGCLGRQIGAKLVVRRDAPGLDARAAGDPLVRRIDELFQVGVGDHALGDVGTHACDGAGAALEAMLGAGVGEVAGR